MLNLVYQLVNVLSPAVMGLFDGLKFGPELASLINGMQNYLNSVRKGVIPRYLVVGFFLTDE